MKCPNYSKTGGNKKKKATAILLALLFAASCVSLIGCSGGNTKIPADSPYIGSWKAVKAVALGEETPIGEVLDEGDYVIILNADGTASSIYGETVNCKWSITNNGVKLIDGTRLTLKSEDGMLMANLFGVKLYFEKQN